MQIFHAYFEDKSGAIVLIQKWVNDETSTVSTQPIYTGKQLVVKMHINEHVTALVTVVCGQQT